VKQFDVENQSATYKKMQRTKSRWTTLMLSVACLGIACQSVQAQRTTTLSTDLTNIAAAANGGRVVNATSVYNDDSAYAASNLIDGKIYKANDAKTSNGWSSNRFDPVNMDSVTLGFTDNAVKSIGKIVLNPGTSVTPERWAKDVEVQVSTESADGPYRAVAQLTLKRQAERQEFMILPAKARFVRLVFRSNWGSDRAIALGEVEIYESISSADPVGQLIVRLEGAIKDLERFQATQDQISGSSLREAVGVGSDATTTTVHAKVSPALSDSTLRLIADAATPSAASGRAVNIAAAANGGKIMSSTSTFSNDPKYSASNLIDGQNFSVADGTGSFGWSSEGFLPGRQSVTIGFKDDRTHLVSRFVLNPASNQNSLRWASRVDVQVTTGNLADGLFRSVGVFNLQGRPINQEFQIRPVEARYVRFIFTANGPGNPLPDGDPNVSSDRSVSLGEIEIYEPPATSGTLVALIGRFNQVLDDLKRLRTQGKLAATPDVDSVG
jgi:hypothetical protein